MPSKLNTVLLEGRGQVYLKEKEREFYARMIPILKEKAGTNEMLFSFPSHPEWYYLTGLKNPTPHIFAGITINSEKALETLMAQFSATPPAIIIFKPLDKYNTKYTLDLRNWLSSSYNK